MYIPTQTHPRNSHSSYMQASRWRRIADSKEMAACGWRHVDGGAWQCGKGMAAHGWQRGDGGVLVAASDWRRVNGGIWMAECGSRCMAGGK